MVFYVAIHQEAWPDQLEHLLATIRANLAASPRLHPGRRRTHVFQRLGQPTQLLSLSMWDSQAAFEQFRQSVVVMETAAIRGSTSTVDVLAPLRQIERMERRSAVLACVTLTAPVERAGALEAYLLSDEHRAAETVDGLVSRAVYRIGAPAGRILLTHSWQSLADLERFRATHGLQGEAEVQALGATMERFTGTIAAEFSTFQVR